MDGPALPKSEPKRRRSFASGSASPQPRSRADSPQSPSRSPSPVAPGTRQARDISPSPRPGRRRVYESESDESRDSIRSHIPDDHARAAPRRDLSPRRDTKPGRRIDSGSGSPVSSRAYGSRSDHGRGRGRGRSAHSRSPIRSPRRERSRSRSRSPHAGSSRRFRDRDDEGVSGAGRRQPTLPPQPPRERSLSPFSKRLALTQAMNMGR